MNLKKFIFRSLLVGVVLSIILRVFPRRLPTKPVDNRETFDAVDDYLRQLMLRLNIPCMSLAII
jgi:hypothetical protein